ncbi:MAG: hypothetical protein LBD11_04550 [Candidatus Peribacteria bacterium]|jgi:hypothetical protein|nr:hypothetical protein [Candidatus Peribacteria bacterium]
MKNPLYSAVHHATTKMNQRNETLNGESPAFLEYKENGRPAKLETLEINADHCHSFIGKMKYQGESIYSEKVLTTLLQFFFDHTSKGEKIVIELANKVSELVNGEESMQGYMDFDTQKGELKRIAKKLNKKRWKDLEIQDISDNNVQLFSLLSEKGIQGLATDTLPPLNAEIDSLGVAQHLYAITQQDPAYLAEFKKLKPHALEDISRNVDYYSLVELSIRINALLHGVDVQGGVKRQEKYDKFLLQHLSYNPKHEQFPALQEFQKFCEQQLQGTSFKALYFDTGKSEKYMDKI